MTEDNESKLEIDWIRTAAGALAAVSSAVALSTLGAAGTIIGAALGSVIITVGGALYSHGLSQSRRRLAEAQALALRKVGVAQAEVRRAGRHPEDEESTEAHLAHADERLAGAKEELEELVDEAPGEGWAERFGALPWKRVALVAAGLFVAALVAITAFELLTGRTVSQMTGGTDGDGGTTISRIGGGADGPERQDERPAEDDAPAPDDPADDPADDPVDEPTDSGSDSPAEESPEPVPSPSVVESELPTEPSESPAPQ